MSFLCKPHRATRLLATAALLSFAAQTHAQGVTPAQVHQDIATSVRANGLPAVLAALATNPYARYQYEVVALTESCQYMVHTVRTQMVGKTCDQARNPSGATEWPNLIREAQQAGASSKRWVNWNTTWDTWCTRYTGAVICVAKRYAKN